ncbi:MAG: PAS domain S-box protein [Acidobacteria bacterium]|nr:PAS domain S-box protein [Acidobacteriota bacterium]
MTEHEFFEAHTVLPFLSTDVETSVAYLRALIDCSPIAIVVLDSQHRYQMCNSSFVKLFQYTRDELRGSDLDVLIADPNEVEEAARLTKMVRNGVKIHEVAHRRRRDGMMIDVEIYGIPLMANGVLAGVYGLYQDVTERNRAQTALRQITNQMEDLQQKERRRIARDLHDSTAQELAVLNWNLARLDSEVQNYNSDLIALVRETREIASQCSSRIRSAAYLLHPPLLGDEGLPLALDSMVKEFGRRSGINVALDLGPEVNRFCDEIEIAVFRIVQEALANVLRHSGSPLVDISLHIRGQWLSLEVSEPGNGGAVGPLLREPDLAPGLGMLGMRERAEQLGGYLNTYRSDGGTTLVAMVPLRIELDG